MKKRIASLVMVLVFGLSLYGAAILVQAGVAHIKGHGDIVFHHSVGTVNYDLKCFSPVTVVGDKFVISNKRTTEATVTILDKDSHEVQTTVEVIWQL